MSLAALAGFAVWLAWPMLFPTYVEGFSAAIVSLGQHLAQDDVASFDRLHPFNMEFFLLSKFGAVLDVAALTRLFGLDGRTAMCAAAILLIPGALENSFFYNDNVPAAALTGAAFVCWSGRPGLAAALLGGFLFGFAVLTRSDAALLAIALPFVFHEK